MAYQPVPNTIQVEMRFLWGNQKCENVFHMQPTAGIAADFTVEAANSVAQWWFQNYRSNLSNALVFIEAYATDLTTQDGGVYTSSANTGLAGAIAGKAVPNNVAYCVTHRTTARGRSGRGRTYIPGLPEASVVDNKITQALADAFASNFNSLRTIAATAGLTVGIVSRQLNNVPRATGLFREVINTVAQDLTVDSQRRRLPGRGD